MTFDMMRYWDGQPVRFVCCSRAPNGQTEIGQPVRKIFWCVSIEVIEEDADEDAEGEDEQVGEELDEDID